jgi:hypothetical protein
LEKVAVLCLTQKKHCPPSGKQCVHLKERFSVLCTLVSRAAAAFFAFGAGVAAFATALTFFAATSFAFFAFFAATFFAFCGLFFALLTLFAVFAFFALFLFVFVAVYISRNLSRGRCVFCKSRVTYTRKSEGKK